MTDTLGTAVMRNHIYIVSYSLAVAHMISFRFRVAASFEDGLVRTFWQTGSTVDTFGGNQQCHDDCLLLLDQKWMDVLSSPQRHRMVKCYYRAVMHAQSQN